MDTDNPIKRITGGKDGHYVRPDEVKFTFPYTKYEISQKLNRVEKQLKLILNRLDSIEDRLKLLDSK